MKDFLELELSNLFSRARRKVEIEKRGKKETSSNKLGRTLYKVYWKIRESKPLPFEKKTLGHKESSVIISFFKEIKEMNSRNKKIFFFL